MSETITVTVLKHSEEEVANNLIKSLEGVTIKESEFGLHVRIANNNHIDDTLIRISAILQVYHEKQGLNIGFDNGWNAAKASSFIES